MYYKNLLLGVNLTLQSVAIGMRWPSVNGAGSSLELKIPKNAGFPE